MPASLLVKNRQMDGHSASHPKGRQLHNAASNYLLDVHNVIQLDPCGSHSNFKQRHSARVRRRTTADAMMRTVRSSCARYERRRCLWSCLRKFGPFCPSCLIGGGIFGPAAGYSGLANPDCPGFFSRWIKPRAHKYRHSLGRELDRAAVSGAIYERIERIGFSVRPLAIAAAHLPQVTINCKHRVVIGSGLRKSLNLFQRPTPSLLGPTDYSATRRSRSALATTLTEESAIAAAPMAGESKSPNSG
mgnify:CR=1 FL=1